MTGRPRAGPWGAAEPAVAAGPWETSATKASPSVAAGPSEASPSVVDPPAACLRGRSDDGHRPGPHRPDRHPRLREDPRSEEHTSELQSRGHLVCRLLLETKKILNNIMRQYDKE